MDTGANVTPEDTSSDSSNADFQPVPPMPPRAHDTEAGGSGSATETMMLKILDRLNE